MRKQRIELFRKFLEQRREELRHRLFRHGESPAPDASDKDMGRLARQGSVEAQEVSLALARK